MTSSFTDRSSFVRATGALCGALAMTAGVAGRQAAAAPLPDGCFANTADFGTMWRQGTTFYILTSGYALQFAETSLSLTRLLPVPPGLTEAEALLIANGEVFTPAEDITLQCWVESNGARYRATGASSSQLVECGKFFQRRFLPQLTYTAGAPARDANQSGIEVVSWPDRVSFVNRFQPTAEILNGALEVSMALSAPFTNLLSYSTGRALTAADGRGYVFMAAPSSAVLTVDLAARKCTARLEPGTWSAGTVAEMALVVYPAVTNCASLLQRVVDAETAPLAMTAVQTFPSTNALSVSYDMLRGWYAVNLRRDARGNDLLERVALSVTNAAADGRSMRLCFSQANPIGITGIAPMLIDEDLYPCGIPVQVSKNWHNATSDRFVGPWFRGLSMLTVPAHTNVSFGYARTGGRWGHVPAASHSQLSLIGWGGNQHWDEAALGCWGETVTFNPDACLGRSMIDDVRPLMVTGMNGGQYSWTVNVGGGNFMRVNSDYTGTQKRSLYRRYGPNMTDVTYGGLMANGAIEMACSTRLFRVDDYVRIYYHLRYDVKQAVSFTRLALFQLGADGYNDHTFNLMARGNAAGLVEEWAPPRGGSTYSRTGMECAGDQPWFSLHQGNKNSSAGSGAWANRGLVIRSWEARLGGADCPAPYASVYGTVNGVASANVELSAPPGVTQLQPGDYVEAELVQLVLPQFAADYYGPNANLAAALTAHGNTWRLVHREVTHNRVDAQVVRGSIEHTFPLRIRTEANGRAEFSITGGLGYQPITLCGLPDYRAPLLQEEINGVWQTVDQSHHGMDFWQTDYVSSSGTWEVTYNLFLDNPDDSRQTRQYRFTLNDFGMPPTDISLSKLTVSENSRVGRTIGLLSATDPDEGETFTYTLAAGDGDDDNALVRIEGDAVKVNATLNHTQNPTLEIRVRATDSRGWTFSKAFVIDVTANSPPLLSAAANVQVGKLVVGTVKAVSPIPGAALTYSLSGGADMDLFDIDPATGVLTLKQPAATVGAKYAVEVAVTDDQPDFPATDTLLIEVATVAREEPPAPAFLPDGGINVNAGLGAASLTFGAVSGVEYLIEYSDDLLLNTWPPLDPPGWQTAAGTAPLTITDPGSSNIPHRFYRIRAR